MELGKTLYVNDRKQWRSWLSKNHDKEKEIWLIYYRKSSGQKRIPYNDAVEEALCYGWIDSIQKGIDEEKFAQRFSPRKPNSVLSQTNKERIHKLINQKKMTAKGLNAVKHVFDGSPKNLKYILKPDILKLLKEDKTTWENFQKFPESYKRIRIEWIEGARTRPELFKKRLEYFLKMTAKNKRYGMVQ
ncbi:YdeI/OmpD-associated family protein [Candidatus Woesearchaeota archaeon]|nr:YdeI/OmpD-associated family protein [Candidatus Woesearchaeota archaeon]